MICFCPLMYVSLQEWPVVLGPPCYGDVNCPPIPILLMFLWGISPLPLFFLLLILIVIIQNYVQGGQFITSSHYGSLFVGILFTGLTYFLSCLLPCRFPSSHHIVCLILHHFLVKHGTKKTVIFTHLSLIASFCTSNPQQPVTSNTQWLLLGFPRNME